jgi:hypothetical protein
MGLKKTIYKKGFPQSHKIYSSKVRPLKVLDTWTDSEVLLPSPVGNIIQIELVFSFKLHTS